jgi:hypothetical protein
VTLPDIQAVKRAIQARLAGDATLATLAAGPFNGRIPSTVDWSKPAIEHGPQADTDDPANGYGQDGLALVWRVMVHDRGPAPGVGDAADCYAALNRAHAVLTSAPLTVTGETVWYLRRTGGIPETQPVDESGHVRMSVGSLYSVRVL